MPRRKNPAIHLVENAPVETPPETLPEQPAKPAGPTTEELAALAAAARSRVEALLERYSGHNWDVPYATQIIPISSDLLLRALVEEGKLDRTEMQLRQLVIQEAILKMEFNRRTVRADEERLSIAKPRGPSLIVPGRMNAKARTNLN
jgi:hypothetical protein